MVHPAILDGFDHGTSPARPAGPLRTYRRSTWLLLFATVVALAAAACTPDDGDRVGTHMPGEDCCGGEDAADGGDAGPVTLDVGDAGPIPEDTGTDAGPPECDPGSSVGCICPDGDYSSAACTDSGHWSPCVCEEEECFTKTRTCWCPNGATGLQDCDEETRRYGDCVCEGDPVELVPGCLEIDQTALTYGERPVQGGRTHQVVTLFNCGSTPLQILSTQVTQDANDSFIISNRPYGLSTDCFWDSAQPCIGNAPLPPTSNDTVEIEFTARAVGSNTGSVRIHTNLQDRPQLEITLEGVGY